MTNKIFLLLILALTLGKLETASAQMEKRIQFAKGKVSTVIKGVVDSRVNLPYK